MSRHEIPGHVRLAKGKGDLPVILVETEFATAEVYTHGAHVAAYQKKGEPPLLFLSEASEFRADKPIRGGVPVIFPWFGPRDGQPMHGFARLAGWDWCESSVATDGTVNLCLCLPDDGRCRVEFRVSVGASLGMELVVANTGGDDLIFESCLHTYFEVGDIRQVSVRGLRGARYRDQLTGAEMIEEQDCIRFSAETDRVYQDSGPVAEIVDASLGRVIRVRKSGSRSTVVWNPWVEKSQRMPDFGDLEYLRMLCVESGNVRGEAITLAPGAAATMAVSLESLAG